MHLSWDWDVIIIIRALRNNNRVNECFLHEVNTNRIRGIDQKSPGAIFSNIVDELSPTGASTCFFTVFPLLSFFYYAFNRNPPRGEKSIGKFPSVFITRNSDILFLGQLQ